MIWGVGKWKVKGDGDGDGVFIQGLDPAPGLGGHGVKVVAMDWEGWLERLLALNFAAVLFGK